MTDEQLRRVKRGFQVRFWIMIAFALINAGLFVWNGSWGSLGFSAFCWAMAYFNSYLMDKLPQPTQKDPPDAK